MWSEQLTGPQLVVSGHPEYANSSAAALLSYDVPHRAPWDWRVSLYTWTKGIAAGAYLVPALLVWAGLLDATSPLWQWVAPLVAALLLGITGLLLIWDLEQPTRFYYLFTHPQPQSWLVRGGYIIGGYGLVLGLHVLAALAGAGGLQRLLSIAGIPLAALTAVYTAYLFAQAKARDLWQSPMLAPHMLVQAVFVGAAALVPFAAAFDAVAAVPLLSALGLGALVHLLFVAAESTFTHPTAHAKLAAWELVQGRFRTYFWAGVLLALPAVAAPWLGVVAVPFALAALLAYEHAYVQAGQAVPLA